MSPVQSSNPAPASAGLAWRIAACAAILFLGGCASAWLSPLERDNPLAGRIWDTRAARFVSPDQAIARAVAARFVILGEVHDNPDHHRLQAKVLAALLHAGRRPVLAMEQFDRDWQAALDASRTSARTIDRHDAARVADAGHFDREGWRWPQYRPLVELALAHGLVLRAANFSRADARALMRTGAPAPGLPVPTESIRARLEADIIQGHCGHRPPAGVLAGMVEAQRARDAHMAKSMQDSGESGAVLIAGAGHARRDRAAPLYLSAAERSRLLSIAFVELEAGSTEPKNYAGTDRQAGDMPEFDLLWFTPRTVREDPCRNLRLPASAVTR